VHSQRVKEQGIHPPLERLIYLTEKEFKFFKVLREKFLRKAGKFLKAEKSLKRVSPERPAEERSSTEEGYDKDRFEYETSEYWKGRETRHWQWVRVYEYFKEQFYEERYEKQLKVARNFINRHHIDRMLISYKY
jgi:hypothetical protein